MNKILKHILLMFIAVIFAFGSIEAFFQFGPIQLPSINEGAYHFPCYTKTEQNWINFKPSTTCTLHSNVDAFPDVEFVTNSFGLRNKEIVIPKPKDTQRILFLGDSFASGFGVDVKDAYPSKTELYLKQLLPDTTIEAINAGLPVVGPNRYYLRYKQKEYSQDASVVVVGLYIWNDIYNNLVDPKRILVDEKGLPIKIDSTNLTIDHEGNIISKQTPWALTLPIISKSKLLLFLASRYSNTINNQKLYKNKLIPKEYCLFSPDCHDYDAYYDEKEQLFLAMKDIADQRNQKLLFVLIPTEFQIDEMDRIKYNIPVPISPEGLELPNKTLSAFFTEHTIDFLDLLPVFRQHQDTQLYFEKDNHWNSAGHDLAAQTIAHYLLKYVSP